MLEFRPWSSDFDTLTQRNKPVIRFTVHKKSNSEATTKHWATQKCKTEVRLRSWKVMRSRKPGTAKCHLRSFCVKAMMRGNVLKTAAIRPDISRVRKLDLRLPSQKNAPDTPNGRAHVYDLWAHLCLNSLRFCNLKIRDYESYDVQQSFREGIELSHTTTMVRVDVHSTFQYLGRVRCYLAVIVRQVK